MVRSSKIPFDELAQPWKVEPEDAEAGKQVHSPVYDALSGHGLPIYNKQQGHLVNCHCKSAFQCVECGKRFSFASALDQHLCGSCLGDGGGQASHRSPDGPSTSDNDRRERQVHGGVATDPRAVIPKFIRQLIEIAQNIPDMRVAMPVLDDDDKSKVRCIIKSTKAMLDDLDD